MKNRPNSTKSTIDEFQNALGCSELPLAPTVRSSAPEQVGQLKKLQTLVCSRNRLTTLKMAKSALFVCLPRYVCQLGGKRSVGTAVLKEVALPLQSSFSAGFRSSRS